MNHNQTFSERLTALDYKHPRVELSAYTRTLAHKASELQKAYGMIRIAERRARKIRAYDLAETLRACSLELQAAALIAARAYQTAKDADELRAYHARRAASFA